MKKFIFLVIYESLENRDNWVEIGRGYYESYEKAKKARERFHRQHVYNWYANPILKIKVS